jgi:HSP20 family protein
MAFNLPSVRKKLENNDTRGQNDLANFFDSILNDFQSLPVPSFQKIRGELSPRIDISETDSAYHIDTDLPGINQKDIDIKLDNNILTIKGKNEEQSETKDRNYYIKERYYGSFQRSISLPSNMNVDNIDARFENGVLHIKIPKKEKENTRKIKIKG